MSNPPFPRLFDQPEQCVSMATVHKATFDLFDRIHPLIQYFNIEDMSREDWLTLLGSRWSLQYDHFGYVLMEEEQVVGFLGTFFYDRKIDGTLHTFCNLFCWYVPEEYRKESLRLLLAVLSLKDIIVTSLTPSREAGLILERFKFEPLEKAVRIFPFIALPPIGSNVVPITDRDSIRSLLTPEDRKLFDDLYFPACRHLVLVDRSDKNRYCYIVHNVVHKKGLRFMHIYSIGNKELFATVFTRIQWYFFRYYRTVLTLIDNRLLVGCVPKGPGFNYTLRYPRLYRSTGLSPDRIDNLYTELLFLKRV